MDIFAILIVFLVMLLFLLSAFGFGLVVYGKQKRITCPHCQTEWRVSELGTPLSTLHAQRQQDAEILDANYWRCKKCGQLMEEKH